MDLEVFHEGQMHTLSCVIIPVHYSCSLQTQWLSFLLQITNVWSNSKKKLSSKNFLHVFALITANCCMICDSKLWWQQLDNSLNIMGFFFHSFVAMFLFLEKSTI